MFVDLLKSDFGREAISYIELGMTVDEVTQQSERKMQRKPQAASSPPDESFPCQL